MALNDPLVHELSMPDYMAAAVGLHGRTPGYYAGLAQAARNWLADREGWRPRPTVSRKEIAQRIRQSVCALPMTQVGAFPSRLLDVATNAAIDSLREYGIEVTDGD